jgi:hypothetical protein
MMGFGLPGWLAKISFSCRTTLLRPRFAKLDQGFRSAGHIAL